MADLIIDSLRGGLNDSDPPATLAKDQCTVATNVEFWDSACGERRRGKEAIDVTTGAGFADGSSITFLYRHFPSDDETATELWAVISTDAAASRIRRKTTTWIEVTPDDAIAGTLFGLNAQTLHHKMFFSYQSAVDRLHVWDGTDLRRVGLTEPAAAPTGANDGGVGTFSATRYYRVRFTRQESGTTILRSEPSEALEFSPNGNDTGVVVTRPAAINEGETHWELEASLDNANFYVIATTALATTTATDTQDALVGYADFELSEDIGDYIPIHSGKFLSADNDRLLIGGHWTDETLSSRVAWTPVFNDPGVGNDERIPLDTDNFIDLDTGEGGGLTALSDTVNGYVYAFKFSTIYKLVRTGQRSRAYDAFAISKSRGALMGSLVEGVDQAGHPCLYFLDPKVGPCRLGLNGLQTASLDILNTWSEANVNSIVPATGIYYPASNQVHWWIASGDSDYPNMHITLQVNESRDTNEGVRRGWTRHTLPSGVVVVTSCMYAENIDDNTDRSLVLKPLIGTNSSIGLIQQLDTGTTDNGTAYVATIVSSPSTPVNILNRFGVMAGALMGVADADAQVKISLIRDFGVEESTAATIDLSAAGSEAHVIKRIDDLKMSNMATVQVRITDITSPTARWEVNQLALKQRKEETS